MIGPEPSTIHGARAVGIRMILSDGRTHGWHAGGVVRRLADVVGMDDDTDIGREAVQEQRQCLIP